MSPARIVLPCLALLAAGLGWTLAWELLQQGAAPPPPVAPPPAAEPQATSPATPPNPAAEWAAVLRARPPFSPDRRPPAPGPTAAAPETPLPRLAGIMVTPEGRSAIFAARPQPLVVREGGIVGRFSIQRIEPGQVTLAGPDGIRTLRPTFDPTAGPRTQPGPTLPGLALPGLPLPGLAQLPLTLPGARPVTGGEAPPIPGTSPTLAEASQDAMPFESIAAPTGMDIIRNQARRQPPGAVSDR